jgi:hypothetical protein
MRDDLDDRLQDAVALDEIDLYANVLSAVAAADRPLTDDELDAVLGLGDAPRGAPPTASRKHQPPSAGIKPTSVRADPHAARLPARRRGSSLLRKHHVGTPVRETE